MTKSKKRNSVATPDAAVPTAAEPEEVTLDQFADQDDEIPSKEWEYYHLWKAVHGCLFSLPEVFHLEFSLPGLRARDLPSANTLMGSAIEEHIPKALNKMRSIWDEDSKYADLIFKRQPQVFPDVVLVRAGDPKAVPVMGIEVKSWYALAGEGVPTFRMCVNRDYCHTWDLAMCVPWSLSYAVTGSVRLYRPLVISAKKAARLRNTYWRGLNHEVVEHPPEAGFEGYPTRKDTINDEGRDDGGGNFGRLARTGVWKADLEEIFKNERISDIPLNMWLKFLNDGKTR